MKVNECIGCGCMESDHYGSSTAFSELAGDKKFTQEPYSILKCKNCGLYYKDHILDPVQLNEYYNSFDFKAWQPTVNYPTEDIIAQYISSRSGLVLLDYGCSEGRFLSTFIQKHKCFGYDIDQRALKIAHEKGVEVLQTNELEQSKGKFDVIILSDVFEHSTAPTKLVGSLLDMLVESGVLIISTGNADAKACQYDLPHFWYFRTVQHVCMLGDNYISYLKNKFVVKDLKKINCSHYKAPVPKRIFSTIRFNLFKFIDSNRHSWLVTILSRVPYVKKITRWEDLPYHPYSKDHVVLFLQR